MNILKMLYKKIEIGDEMSVYILQTGDYHRNRNVLVTTDVKTVAKEYVKLINEGAFGSSHDNPYIEIWNEGDREHPTANFHKNENNEKRLVKFLSKLSRKI